MSEKVRIHDITEMVAARFPDAPLGANYTWRVAREIGIDVHTDGTGAYISPADARPLADMLIALIERPVEHGGELWYDTVLAADYLTESTGFEQKANYIWKMLARRGEYRRKELFGRLRTPQSELDDFTEWYVQLPIGEDNRPRQPKRVKNVNITFTQRGENVNAKRSKEENEQIIARMIERVRKGKLKPVYVPGPDVSDRPYTTLDQAVLFTDKDSAVWRDA